MVEYCDEAINILRNVSDNEATNALEKLMHYVINRKKRFLDNPKPLFYQLSACANVATEIHTLGLTFSIASLQVSMVAPVVRISSTIKTLVY